MLASKGSLESLSENRKKETFLDYNKDHDLDDVLEFCSERETDTVETSIL